MIDGLSYGGDSLYTRRTWSALEIRERERERLRAEKARKAEAVAYLYRLAEQADDAGDEKAFEQMLEAAIAAERRPAYMF